MGRPKHVSPVAAVAALAQLAADAEAQTEAQPAVAVPAPIVNSAPVSAEYGSGAIKMEAAGGKCELWLYGPVTSSDWGDEGICSGSIRKALQEAGPVDQIDCHLNSRGGDAFEGMVIYQILAQHPAKVNMLIDMLAASAAATIACSGDTIQIAETGLMMVHDPSTFAYGTADDFRRLADDLDRIRDSATSAYMGCVKKRGKKMTPEEMKALMKENRFMTAQEAMDAGFVDSIMPAKGNEEPAAKQSLLNEYAQMVREFVQSVGVNAAMNARKPNTVTDPEPVAVITEPVVNATPTELPAEAVPTAALDSQGTVAQEHNEMAFNLASIAGILGLDSGATEETVTTALNELKTHKATFASLAAELEKITGQAGQAALAVVQAFKSSHEALPAVQGELAEIKAKQAADKEAADKAALQTLVEQGVKDGKLTEAQKTWAATQTLENLTAYLAVAIPVIPGAGAPPVREATTGTITLTAEQRKVAQSLGLSEEKYAESLKAEALNKNTDLGSEEDK